MENYTRRNTKILSLIIFFVITYGCCSKFKNIIPPPIPVVKIGDGLIRNYKKQLIVTLVKDYKPNDSTKTKFSERLYKDDFDSLISKNTNQKISKDNYFVISIKDFIKDYKIKNGFLLSFNDENSTIDVLRYENDQNIILSELKNSEFFSVEEILKTEDGFIDFAQGMIYKQSNIDYLYNNMENVYLKYIENDEIKYKVNNKYLPLRNFFNDGNGYWEKNYYLKKDLEYIRVHMKEEGEVKNNFKFGEWKYYDKEGKIDSIKIYSIKDSVDVRFPHCIFNKNEPCY